MKSFLIAEAYVPKEELLTVAKAVLLAQDIKENSWDTDTKDYAKNDAIAAKEAVEQLALKEMWATVIYMWNRDMWNDAQGWAECTIKDIEKEQQ